MGIFNKYSLTAAAAALAFSTAPAIAADFGGDCCADLEERVATLEATTARKGNRKVSLVISGQVNQALMIWDDGEDTDAYVINNGNSSTRIRFKGGAKINHDWSAGYYLEVEVRSTMSFRLTQNDDDGTNPGGIDIRQSNMWIASKTFGKLTIGQQSPATDDLAFYGSVAGIAGHYQPDWHYGQNMFLANSAGGLSGVQLSELSGSVNGFLFFDGTIRQNVVRYDTPTIAGFVLSASWGEDDFYDVALRYAGAWGDFTVKGAIGYSVFENPDASKNAVNANKAGAVAAGDEESLSASAGIMHTPTGLFAHFAWRSYEYDMNQVDSQGYQVQAGIKNRWNSLGATAIYGAYTNVEDGHVRNDNGITSSEIDRWSVGATQWIDAAAMELYVVYDHTEAEAVGFAFEDFDTVTIGGRIKF